MQPASLSITEIEMDYANKTKLLGKRNRLSDNAKTAIAAFALFAAYALVGTMEYNDLQADARTVCTKPS